MKAAGLDVAFIQDNESLSAQKGTLRGLHYQAPPFAQAKLVRVGKGAILDVAVDARRGSPTFGRWVAEEISAENGAQILVPRGFLHGFVTLTADTLVIYKVDNVYDAASDGSVAWNDADIGVDWGVRRRRRSCPTRTAGRRPSATGCLLSSTGCSDADTGDGRRGLHRLGRGAAGDRRRPRGRQPRRADLCGEPRQPRRRRRLEPLRLREGRHPRPRRARRHLRQAPARRGDAPRRREPRRPLDRRARRPSSTPTSSAPTPCSRRRAPTGAASATSASTTSRPTRCSARSGDDGQVHRDHALRAELALFGVEGRVRPPRPRLARDLRPAGRALELLEQLRAVPVSREADPGGDPQRPRRPRDPGLRQGRERPRLALRRGPRDRAPRRGAAGQARARATTSAATPRRRTSRSSAASAR